VARKPLEKGGRYMDTLKATVVEDNDKYFIDIENQDETIRIPMSDDLPNEVKSSFNKLIRRLKQGQFTIKIDEVQSDLFSQVANEYIKQLNRELKEVFGEMEGYNLIEK
jgi:hypothetical protein